MYSITKTTTRSLIVLGVIVPMVHIASEPDGREQAACISLAQVCLGPSLPGLPGASLGLFINTADVRGSISGCSRASINGRTEPLALELRSGAVPE